jgi:hypothetical protein
MGRDRDGKKYSPTYWCDKGKFQKEMDELHAKLIPPMGEASTVEGEVLRQLVNFYYDRYNNGHCNSRPVPAVRAFLKKTKAPATLKCKIDMLDVELDETVDYVVETISKLTTYTRRK